MMAFSQSILTCMYLLLFYMTCLGVYRIWLSPVSNIPGPLLAKLTYWYEFYWDVIRVGQYTFHIRSLHDKYGPIIRLNPHEVHIDDPDFYDDVFTSSSSGRKRERWYYLMAAFGLDDSTFSTISHDLHRVRRAALSPFFSKAKIRALQGRIERILNKMLRRVHEFRQTNKPMSIGIAFTSITHDIVSAYTIDLQDFRIDAPDFGPDFHVASEKLQKSTHLMKQFHWLLKLTRIMPVSLIALMDADMGAYLRVEKNIQKVTKEIQTAHGRSDYKPPEQSTILHGMLDSDQIPQSEKSYERLWQDTDSVIVAGTVTTSVVLSNLFFHLLSDPNKLRRLRAELHKTIPDKDGPLPLSKLENLSYMTACIREALRVANGLSSRLQRIDPEKNIVFHAKKESYGAPAAQDLIYVIPPGTPVSMTQLHIHFNPRIYPDPQTFVPERWLEKDPTADVDRVHHRLDKYYVPFSRGMRACLGINLAEAELYLITASIFRRYGSKDCQMPGDDGYLELFDSSYERDIEIVGDGFAPMVREPLKGIKVKVHPCDFEG